MEDIFEELAAAASDEEERGEGNGETRADEAEEVNDENKRVVKPKRTASRAPRPKLDPARLIGPRGIFVLSSTFDNIKFRGKNHELDDLNNVLSRLQHWAHRLFPKMTFEDCISRIEELGQKREIQTNMHKLRMGMIDLEQPQEDTPMDEGVHATPPSPPQNDAFDQLISTVPAPAQRTTLTDEQRARMLQNRLLAEERRQARRIAREKELEEQRQAALQEPDLLRQTVENTQEHMELPLSTEVTDGGSQLRPPSSPVESRCQEEVKDTLLEPNTKEGALVDDIDLPRNDTYIDAAEPINE